MQIIKRVSLFLTAAMMIAVLGCNRERTGAVSSNEETAEIITTNAETVTVDHAADIEWITITESFTDTAAAESAPIAFQAEEEQTPVITLVKMPADFRGEYHFFTDDHTSETMMFLATESVENFAYIEIYPFIDPNDDFFLLAGELLFGLDVFTPEMPFVVTASIGSGIPARAIHFEYKGTVKYFYITESGMDGSLQLVEFTPFMG